MLDHPRLFFLLSLFMLWLSAQFGASWRRRRALKEEEREDFAVVQAATLTLLGLIIGFSFSMATTRYDLRKTYEEAEANAIGTEYVRAGLMPAVNVAGVRALLKKYLDLRISFYNSRGDGDLQQVNADTAQLQNQMWAAVQDPAVAQPSPVIALAVAGMNDVLNSQGYTQAAWWNRIPGAAWMLMFAIAIFCNGLLGYGSRRLQMKLLVILPLVVAVSFFLIADIDSPRRGIIRVRPQNLESVQQSLK
jgi:hypothetical protein